MHKNDKVIDPELFLVYLSKFKPKIDFRNMQIKKVLNSTEYFNLFLNHNESSIIKEKIKNYEDKLELMKEIMNEINEQNNIKYRHRLPILFHLYGTLKFFEDNDLKGEVCNFIIKQSCLEEDEIVRFSMINSLTLLGFDEEYFVKDFIKSVFNQDNEGNYSKVVKFSFYYLIFYYGSYKNAKEKIKEAYEKKDIPLIYKLFELHDSLNTDTAPNFV